ncbi:MAG: formate dehydrogenase accessory protein FdhE [Spirochaetes bacterium]|nr:formate dehydrogenase accessory protein FdhE [Spirochaetota bacterium]
MKEHHNFLKNQKDNIEKNELLPQDVYCFYVDFFEAQFHVYEELRGRIENFNSTKATFPIIDRTQFLFVKESRNTMNQALHRLAQIIVKYNMQLDFSLLLNASNAQPHFMESLAMKVLGQEKEDFEVLSQEFRIDADEIIFFAVNWLKPYMVLFAEKIREGVLVDSWEKSRCPICGYFPDMALIKEAQEGKRFLHCALCESEWPFKRLACTICGEEDAHKIGYFEIDGNPEYRVDYCDSCRGYIKTRRISKIVSDDDYDISVDNILTVGLDSQLIERGYTRP